MYQPPYEGREPGHHGLLESCLACLTALARCLCCLGPEMGSSSGDGDQRLLNTQAESHMGMGIEAGASPPPRLPSSADRGPLLKGCGPSSSNTLQPAASPPMPPPFFPPPRRPKHRGSGGSPNGSSSPDGGSPTAAAAAAAAAGGKQLRKGGSKVALQEEEEDVCPTCLDPYSEDNPMVLTRCGHHFHLPCLYEWLERSETCPVCGAPMQFDEIV